MSNLSRLSRHLVGCLLLIAALGLAASAHAAALVTILDGEASAIEGLQVVAVSEAQPLADQTILRTGPRTTLLRLEWPDGTVVDLGPDTHVMIAPAGFGPRDKRPPAIYLMRGWAKLASAGKDGVASARLVAPTIDVQPFKGSAVTFVGPGETWIFAEGGGASLVERGITPAGRPALRSGEVYLRSADAKGSVEARPTPAQMQRVPRGFRDTLPLRAAALKDRKVEVRVLAPPDYAQLREWLLAEPAWHKDFLRRFGPRLRDPAFKADMVKNLGSHPEWVPLVYPERIAKPDTNKPDTSKLDTSYSRTRP